MQHFHIIKSLSPAWKFIQFRSCWCARDYPENISFWRCQRKENFSFILIQKNPPDFYFNFFSFVSQKKEENVSRFRPSFLSNLSSFHKSNKIWTQILCVVFVCVFCVVQLKSNAIQLNLMILEKLFILAFPLESLLQLLLLVFFSYSINRLQNNSCRCETNFVSLINIYSVKLFNRVDGGDTRNKKKILSDKEKLRKLFLLRLVFFFCFGLVKNSLSVTHLSKNPLTITINYFICIFSSFFWDLEAPMGWKDFYGSSDDNQQRKLKLLFTSQFRWLIILELLRRKQFVKRASLHHKSWGSGTPT